MSQRSQRTRSTPIVINQRNTVPSAGRRKKGPAPRPRGGGRQAPRAAGSVQSAYQHALTHPFDSKTDGCRVPDPYAQATAPNKNHSLYSVTSTAGGEADFVVLPRVDLSILNTRGAITGGNFTNSPANSPVPFYGAVNDFAAIPGLGAFCTSYRLVTFGVRIRSNATFSNATGRVTVARLPAPRDLPGSAMLPAQSIGSVLDACNVPNSGNLIAKGLQSLPGAQTYTLSQLATESGAEFTFHPISPSGLTFLDGVRTTIETNAVGAALVQYQEGYYSTDGLQMLVVVAEGLPASTNIFTVEVVYHLEWIPKLATGMVQSGMVPARAPPGAAAAAHQAVSHLPIGHTLKEKAEMIQRHGENLARVHQQLTSGYREGRSMLKKVEQGVSMLLPGLL